MGITERLSERRRDAGASAVEYAGLIVIAALLVGVLLASGVLSRVQPATTAALCEILGGRTCARPTPGPTAAKSYAPAAVTPGPSAPPSVPPPPGIDRTAYGVEQDLDLSFDRDSGIWDQPDQVISWWQGANALTAMLDRDLCAGQKGGLATAAARTAAIKHLNGFTNEYNDDTGWWALAYIRAYDLTGDPQDLKIAKQNADKMWNTGHDGKLGGGLYWRDAHDGKNAITNELYIQVAAELHNRIPGDTAYLGHAQDTWNWFKKSGVINSGHLVNDGIDNSGHNNQGPTWTYNQGVILGGLVDLYRATGNKKLLGQARKIADATVTSPKLSPNGILTEPCKSQKCSTSDQKTFKGVFVRDLAELNQALPGHPYQSYLDRQAAAITQKDTNGKGAYGFNWAGPYKGGKYSDPADQASALDAFTAAHCAHPDTK